MTTSTTLGAESAAVSSFTRWGVVIGALIIQMILGTVYAFSIFVEPFESTFGWTRTQITATASIGLAVFALSMVPAGSLQDRRGPRFTALLSAGFLGAGFLAVSQIRSLAAIYVMHGLVTAGVIVLLLTLVHAITPNRDSSLHTSLTYGVVVGVAVASLLIAQRFITGDPTDSLWMLYLTYGFLGGAGIGFGYVSPIAACVKWFPRHRGLITGVAVAGFGAGSMIFAPTASWTIAKMGWPTFFLIHGIVATGGLVIGGLLLKNPPPDYDAGQPATQTRAARDAQRTETGWEEIIRTPAFWRLWVMFVFAATGGLMTIAHLAPFAHEVKLLTVVQAAGAVAVLAPFNAGGRIAWGALSDRIGRSHAMAIMFALQAIMMFAINAFTGLTLFYVAAAWIGFNFGGIFALFPSATADAFGTRALGTNYGIVFTAYGVAGILGPIVAARVYDLTNAYTYAFLFAGVLCILATILALFGQRRPRQMAAEPS